MSDGGYERDRALEIAQEYVNRSVDALEQLGWAADDGIPEHIRASMVEQFAACLRSYKKE